VSLILEAVVPALYVGVKFFSLILLGADRISMKAGIRHAHIEAQVLKALVNVEDRPNRWVGELKRGPCLCGPSVHFRLAPTS
jgi:hypothetical protein